MTGECNKEVTVIEWYFFFNWHNTKDTILHGLATEKRVKDFLALGSLRNLNLCFVARRVLQANTQGLGRDSPGKSKKFKPQPTKKPPHPSETVQK
jgi:hypothetical protein